MNALFKKTAGLFMAASLLAGCKTSGAIVTLPVQCRVVTKIDVAYQRDTLTIHRQYTSQEKMSQVLTYLRLLDRWNLPAMNPDAAPGHVIRITVAYSDGEQTVYHQKADQYFKTGEDRWRNIDPFQALQISQIITELPSDI